MRITKSLFYFSLFVMAIIGISCEDRNSATSISEQNSDVYLNQFKLTYFRQLLAKSYNNSTSVQEIISTDHSGFTEPVLTESDYKFIDSLTTRDNQHLVFDSTQGHKRAEGAQGKRPLGYIMEKLTSSWLDSLAKHRLALSGASNNLAD